KSGRGQAEQTRTKTNKALSAPRRIKGIILHYTPYKSIARNRRGRAEGFIGLVRVCSACPFPTVLSMLVRVRTSIDCLRNQRLQPGGKDRRFSADFRLPIAELPKCPTNFSLSCVAQRTSK